MKKVISILCLALFTLPCLAADKSDNRLHFKKSGFSIAPLEGKSGSKSYQVLMMFLPASESFSPNINIIIQPYGGSIKEYAALSQQQFKELKLTILSTKLTKTSVVWEYSGVVQNSKLHWYSKATRKNGKVFLATATSTESQWKTLSAKLKTCVNSFKIDKDKQPAKLQKK